MSPVPRNSVTCPHLRLPTPNPRVVCASGGIQKYLQCKISVKKWSLNGKFVEKAIHSGHLHANFGLSALCALSVQWNFSKSTNQNESIERVIWRKTWNATGNKMLPSCRLAGRSWMCPFYTFCSRGANLNVNAFRRFSNRICCSLHCSSLFCLLSSLLWSLASSFGRAWDS